MTPPDVSRNTVQQQLLEEILRRSGLDEAVRCGGRRLEGLQVRGIFSGTDYRAASEAYATNLAAVEAVRKVVFGEARTREFGKPLFQQGECQ